MFLIIRDVNNYCAMPTNAISYEEYKVKGCFETDKLYSRKNGNIIYEAVIKNIIDNIDIEETIKSCDNIIKFMFSFKSKYSVYLGGEKIQKINRYVVTVEGKPMTTIDINNTVKFVPYGECVSLINKFEKVKINFDFYIERAKLLLNELTYKEFNIFGEN
jgi:hypothetical protein